MGSVDISNFIVNGDVAHENFGPKDSVTRLHDIVHRLEEENEFLIPLRQNDKSPTGHSNTNGFVSHISEGEEEIDTYMLEHVPPLNDNEFDEVDYEKDDSWLYSTPKRSHASSVNSSDAWLKENAITPELLRVRGSLSEKLEIIAIENRKGRYGRLKKSKEDFCKGSTLSLDWDFEANDNGTNVKKKRTVLPRGVQAWTENSIIQQEEYIPKSSPPDWSDDDDDDFGPMRLNLSKSQCQARKQTGNMAFKRGQQGQSIAAVRPRTVNSEQSEFIVKPTGAMKPRRPAQQRDIDMQYDEERAYSSSSPGGDYEDSGPVVPRGRIKKDMRSISPGDYDESVSAPVILRGTAKKSGHSSDSVSPRVPANIVKPVQRRKQPESPDSDNQVRLRGTGSANPNQVRPRGSGNTSKLSPNNSDLSDSSLKVSLSSLGDGPAVRRRGPVQTAEVAPMPPRRSCEPSPRRAKDPLTAVRQQEVTPVRRSTGSLPQPSSRNDNLPRPRRSFSPTGAVRPRGGPPM